MIMIMNNIFDLMKNVCEQNKDNIDLLIEKLQMSKKITGTVQDVYTFSTGKNVDGFTKYSRCRGNIDSRGFYFIAHNCGETRGDECSCIIIEIDSRGLIFAVHNELHEDNPIAYYERIKDVYHKSGKFQYNSVSCSESEIKTLKLSNKKDNSKGLCYYARPTHSSDSNTDLYLIFDNKSVIDKKIGEKVEVTYDKTVGELELEPHNEQTDSYSVTINSAAMQDKYSKKKFYRITPDSFNGIWCKGRLFDENDHKVNDTINASITSRRNVHYFKPSKKPNNQIKKVESAEQKDESAEQTDSEYKSQRRSPFAYYPGEKVINKIEKPVSANIMAFNIRKYNKITEEDIVIAKIVHFFNCLTNHLLGDVFRFLDYDLFELQSYSTVFNEMKKAISKDGISLGATKEKTETGMFDAHGFENEEGSGSTTMMVLSISKNGLSILKARDLVVGHEKYNPLEMAIITPYELKRRLSSVQLFIMQNAFYKMKKTKIHILRKDTIYSKAPGVGESCIVRPSLIIGDASSYRAIYEVVRSMPEDHIEGLREKIKRLLNVIDNYDTVNTDGAPLFDKKPKLIFITEGEDHMEKFISILTSLYSEESKRVDLEERIRNKEILFSHDTAITHVTEGRTEVEKYENSHHAYDFGTGEFKQISLSDIGISY